MLPNSGQTRPSPAALAAGGGGICGTLQGVTGGTQTHSRRTGSKLGRLHCARQGLVRVPESNTKYGGKRGKPRGAERLRYRQVSVSPQGFPSEKNLYARVGSSFARCSQGSYLLWGQGLLPGDSHEATGGSG